MSNSSEYIFAVASFALAFHGIALAILILSLKKGNRLTYTFTALLIVPSLILVEYAISFGDFITDIPHLIAVKIPLFMLLGPLYFLWTRYRHGHQVSTWQLLHLIPFLAIVAILLPYYILSGDQKLTVAYSDQGETTRNLYLIAAFVHLLYYLILTRIESLKADLKEDEASFANLVHWGFSLLTLCFGVAILYSWIFGGSVSLSRFLYVLSLGMAINFLAYVMLKRPNSFSLKNGLNQLELKNLALKARAYLETEKPYLSKEFNKGQLANALDSNENYVSKAFNEVLKSSFTSYINQLRVEEAKRLLLTGDLKIYAVALDSGFSNKGSFTRVFKQYTNKTPSEFRKLPQEMGHNS